MVIEHKINMIIPDWHIPSNVKAFTVTKEDPAYSAPYPLRQVHQAGVVVLPYPGADRIEGDAALTHLPNVTCSIETADCLPLLVTNNLGTEVAAIHAGWKGLVAGVIEATFGSMQSQAKDCRVWIGPAICGQCFEVGEEVREAFLAKNPVFAEYFIKGAKAGKWYGNLAKIAKMILQDLGVAKVSLSEICTIEDLRCDSYRREKGTQRRMITGIYFIPSALIQCTN